MSDWRHLTRRTPPADSTSNQRPESGLELAHEAEVDDVLNRSAERRYWTPRRYEDRTDPALVLEDSRQNTKI